MPSFSSDHKVNHKADEMFRLVADVERYPEFVPLCQDLHVRGRKELDGGRTVLVADMTVAYKLFKETFTSRVELRPQDRTILVEYLDGPFKHLENKWTFGLGRGQLQRRFLYFLRIPQSDTRLSHGRHVRKGLPKVFKRLRSPRGPGLRDLIKLTCGST